MIGTFATIVKLIFLETMKYFQHIFAHFAKKLASESSPKQQHSWQRLASSFPSHQASPHPHHNSILPRVLSKTNKFTDEAVCK